MLCPISEELPEIEMNNTGGESLSQAADAGEGVMAGAMRCMNFRIRSLYPVLTNSPEVRQALNAILQKHHDVTVDGFLERNGGEYILFSQVNETLSVRLCELDRNVYSLRQTLEWVVNERDGSIQWALEFWARECKPIWNQR